MGTEHTGVWKEDFFEIRIVKAWGDKFSVRSDSIEKIKEKKGTLRAIILDLKRTVIIPYYDLDRLIVGESEEKASDFDKPYKYCYFEIGKEKEGLIL